MKRDESQAKIQQLENTVAELAATVSSQRDRLDQQQQTIANLLAALRGKQRERIDPDQLLLFDIGDLESLTEEQQEESRPKRKRKRNGRRLLPDHLPREEVLHELPEAERRCPLDGNVMQPIRYETSNQLEYEPARS